VLNDELRVRHVLDAISEVESYLKGVSLEAFLSNSEKRFACIKQLEIIGIGLGLSKMIGKARCF